MNKTIEPQLQTLLGLEEKRQHDRIRLIASENYASQAVRQACSSVLMNKYSEGYPGKRFYEGQQVVDQVERLAIARARELFGAEHANVQPYSGSPANLAVYHAFLKPGDTVLGLDLDHGGHLTHGSKASVTGKWFHAVHYKLDPLTGYLDMASVAAMARLHRPKLLVCGHSAWPRIPDFAGFRAIADEVGAVFWVDMAHFAGLVAGRVHPNPVPLADVVTTTTHKTLRGPRGGMILCKEQFASRVDRALFPGLQGGPHVHNIAGIAQALWEASQPEFSQYTTNVVINAETLAEGLRQHGFDLVTGGTQNHLLLLDLRRQGVDGKTIAEAMDLAGLVANANKVPWDHGSASRPSGLRLGTAAVTTRGMGVPEMVRIADWFKDCVAHHDQPSKLEEIRAASTEMARKFPVP
ncbi:MAG: serine hydroxymethyltransferase [Fibrobacteres bacterium]|nr:serine hydroxymethyltransferase [Fibrobacterota bacterium]